MRKLGLVHKLIAGIVAAAVLATSVPVERDSPLTGRLRTPLRGQSLLAPESQVKAKDFRKEFTKEASRDPSRIRLEDGARIVVIGGGPAGSFFAINLLRKAKELGKKVEVVIVEEKKDLQFYGLPCQALCKEGCNYCAGSISPRMSDVLNKLGLEVPRELIQDMVGSITVQGDWKNMELKVPKDRRMFSVYRGARPKTRADRFYNFDSWLLEKAKEAGATVVTGKAYNINRSSDGRPKLNYKVVEGSRTSEETLAADFLVFAGGINHPAPGANVKGNEIQKALREMIPGFVSPKTRRATIFELEADEESIRRMKGEVFFVEYGSKDLKLEMCSIMPKGRYLTVVLIGESVDRGEPRIKERFLELPHVKKMLPKNAKLTAVCACSPNMTVATAKNPFGDRVAVVGDAVASRLYKDGILSAYITANTLASAALDVGVDEKSLRYGYGPVITGFRADNFFGRFVFMLNRIVFKNPSLSRILYQAIFSERKMKSKSDRRLENILWKIASGDGAYVNIFVSMLHPLTIKSIFVGGALVTLRNYLTERVFGIDWRGIGRYPTGVYKEVLEAKREELITNLGAYQLEKRPDFESMYSIRIRSGKKGILSQLGKFGEDDVEYFRPRMISVRRVKGEANSAGSVLRYRILFGLFSFDLALEEFAQGRYLVYKVKDGFAKGGMLVFDIDEVKKGESMLSIYVAFNVPKGRRLSSRIFWRVFSWIFPSFLHDVIWNHSLCKLKDIVEEEQEQAEPDTNIQPSGSTDIGNRANLTRGSALAPKSRFEIGAPKYITLTNVKDGKSKIYLKLLEEPSLYRNVRLREFKCRIYDPQTGRYLAYGMDYGIRYYDEAYTKIKCFEMRDIDVTPLTESGIGATLINWLAEMAQGNGVRLTNNGTANPYLVRIYFKLVKNMRVRVPVKEIRNAEGDIEKIEWEFKEIPLEEALRLLKEKSYFKFYFEDGVPNPIRPAGLSEVEERRIDVSQGDSKKTNEHRVSLGAGLTVCLAVAAFNPKTGERAMAHFLPTGHQEFSESDEISLNDAKAAYLERLLKDIKGEDWQVVIVASEKSAFGNVPTANHILPVEIRGYLVNRNGVDRTKVTMYPDMPEGMRWRRVTINDKGEIEVEDRISMNDEMALKKLFAVALNHRMNQKLVVIYDAVEEGRLDDLNRYFAELTDIISLVEGIVNPVDIEYFRDTRMLDIEGSNVMPKDETEEEKRVREAKVKLIRELGAPLVNKAKKVLGEIEENLRLLDEKPELDEKEAIGALDRIRRNTESIEYEVKVINRKADMDHTGDTKRLTNSGKLAQEVSRCP